MPSLPDLAVDAVTIVVKGNFNPSIFSPAWLLAEDLISTDDYAAAETQVISPEIASFSTSWLQVQVARDSLQLATVEPEEFERTRDAAVGVLRALSHTPIGVLGINRSIHFASASLEEWHRLGHSLTPKAVWKDVLKDPGMMSLTVWGAREDDLGGHILVQVEPSVHASPGIYIAHNDHYNLSESDREDTDPISMQRGLTPDDMSPKKIAAAAEVLENRWQDSMNRAVRIFERVARESREET